MDPRELAALNNIGDASRIQVGQVLVLRPAPVAPVTETGVVTVNPVTGSAPIEARPLGTTVGAAPGSMASGAPAAAAPSASFTASAALKTGPKAEKLPYSEQNLALLQRGGAGAAAPAARPEAAPPAAPIASTSPPATGDDAIDWGWPAAGRVTAGFQENGSKGLSIAGKARRPGLRNGGGPGRLQR
ncbi:MAG: hypothetical protein M5U08_14865 [Burkholderiales bacterium]|nr:hypothetical protein [Burkholderiales bacterium]